MILARQCGWLVEWDHLCLDILSILPTNKNIARIANAVPVTLYSRVTLNVEIVVLNCQKCNHCLKGQKSLRAPFECFLLMYLSLLLSLSLSLYLSLCVSLSLSLSSRNDRQCPQLFGDVWYVSGNAQIMKILMILTGLLSDWWRRRRRRRRRRKKQ